MDSPNTAPVRSTASETFSRLAVTPVPAWAMAGSLLATFPRAAALPTYKPSRLSCLGFGGALALGGYIIYDGDQVNGAGFASAWSTLYLMANGKAALKQLRPWPALLSGGALGTALLYGREFFFLDTGRTRL
ncbi:uncharacterized protein V1510DRAFT_404289 [Dipodascopsis tothii]|uniref:uncharacterized protein n=1 Tax=Dipodascopsis tothii TaxID=44089 RepID=UPI0034CF1CCF